MQSDVTDRHPFPVEVDLARVREIARKGDPGAALTLLQELEKKHLASGLLWEMRGTCHRALGDTAAALAAFQHAVGLNNALAASWTALQELYTSAGRPQ